MKNCFKIYIAIILSVVFCPINVFANETQDNYYYDYNNPPQANPESHVNQNPPEYNPTANPTINPAVNPVANSVASPTSETQHNNSPAQESQLQNQTNTISINNQISLHQNNQDNKESRLQLIKDDILKNNINIGDDDYYGYLNTNINKTNNFDDDFQKYKNYSLITSTNKEEMNDILHSYLKNGYYQRIIPQTIQGSHNNNNLENKVMFPFDKIKFEYIVKFTDSKWTVKINNTRFKELRKEVSGITIIQMSGNGLYLRYRTNNLDIKNYLISLKQTLSDTNVSISDIGDINFYLEPKQCLNMSTLQIESGCI